MRGSATALAFSVELRASIHSGGAGPRRLNPIGLAWDQKITALPTIPTILKTWWVVRDVSVDRPATRRGRNLRAGGIG